MRAIVLGAVLLLVAGCNLSDDPQVATPDDNCDRCGVCDDDSSNDCEQDCAGEWGGDAVEDACGVCDADSTNDCVVDCAGEAGGDAVEDACGVCDADPSNDCEADCAGEPGGDAVEDACGVCDADPTNDCVVDCAGEPGGDAVEDMCGVCDADPTNDCVADCSGEFGGEAETDACGRCVGGDTGLTACPVAEFVAIEDTFVRQLAPTENHGDEPVFVTDRENATSFIKFDLSTLPTDVVIRSLRIRLVATAAESFGGSGDVNVFFSSEDGWQESQVTFDSAPSFSDFIVASTNVANFVDGQDMEIEIVDDPELIERFQSEVWGNKVVTLRLASPGYRTAFHSTEANETSLHPRIEIAYQELASFEVPPVADTYVREGAPDQNFGSETEMRVDPRAGAAAFMKFDLSTVPNITIQRASLQVISHTGFAYGGNGNVYTYLVEDDSWEESEVTFNNSPSWVNEELGFWFIWHNGSLEDKPGINASEKLLAPVLDAYNGDKLISFRLASPGYRTLYRTREFTNPDQRPKLVLYYLPD